MRSLLGFCERVDALHNRLASAGPLELIDEVVAGFDLKRHWREEQPELTAKPGRGDPLELLELVRLHAAESTTREDLLTLWDKRAEDELAQVGMEQDKLSRERNEKQDRVVISTIHASKGREYDAVVIPEYDGDARAGSLARSRKSDESCTSA